MDANADDVATLLLELSRRLLVAIDTQDWKTYCELCDAELTAFEPEACGQLVEGLDFHRFYFELPGHGASRQSTMSAPRVRVFGDVAVVTCSRLVQIVEPPAAPRTRVFEETRVWQRRNGDWKNIHFHRSEPAA